MKATQFILRLNLVSLLTWGCLLFGQAQDKPIKVPEKISVKDFAITNPQVDSNASALVLFNIGSIQLKIPQGFAIESKPKY